MCEGHSSKVHSHHLFPNVKCKKEFPVKICKDCHKWIHKVFTNRQLRELGHLQFHVRQNYHKFSRYGEMFDDRTLNEDLVVK
jgi:hypothetical protein